MGITTGFYRSSALSALVLLCDSELECVGAAAGADQSDSDVYCNTEAGYEAQLCATWWVHVCAPPTTAAAAAATATAPRCHNPTTTTTSHHHHHNEPSLHQPITTTTTAAAAAAAALSAVIRFTGTR